MKIQPFTLVGSALLALTLSPSGMAMDYGQGLKNLAPSLLLENTDGRNDHWKGIGRLQLSKQYPEAYCTATLVDTRGEKQDLTGPAYLLTSAHCVSQDTLNFTVDEPSDGHVDFNYFHDTSANRHRYNVKQVSWSSQRGQDLAVIELDVTLQRLIEDGIQPLRLASKVPVPGDDLLIVGAPSQFDEKGLRLSTCSYLSSETLIEQPAVFRNFYKDQCRGLKPGSSGSPVLDRLSNQVLAVVATTTAGALEENRCFADAPCELQKGQPRWAPASNYSNPVRALAKCFVDGQFEPKAAGCDLLPTVSFTPKSHAIRYYKRIKNDAQGNPVLPTWKMAFDLSTPFYRHKTVRDPQHCSSPRHYSQALAAKDALIDGAVGTEPGLYVLCVIGVDSEDQPPSPALMNNPLLITMEIAQPGPTRAPQLDIRKKGSGGYSVEWQFSHPGLSAYEYKLEKDCEDTTGYTRAVETLTVEKEKLPASLCSRAIDMSGQRSAPRKDLLD